ncbi:ribokinase [Pseudoxanthomonas broegbernensis]|uniref:Ribokinase n=1 Tax=Pseudoxanthomonas broegbernensis TaxID=83619 RepID=A0A7V8K6F6_9GAMM|nr:ribokinase [Pseudoxanthomonas broegbernensis]KAF1685851.1 ribokinase [Pseudoxanthomonas broegbernensis]MBB6064065.1 ribokinase [Pseudoxanthomonas broegbernensis]
MSQASSPTVLVAGSANLDFVVRAPRIPAPGETVLGGGFRTYPGGKGANQAVACARAGGVRTRMLVAMGQDAHAVPLLGSLQAAGVETELLKRDGAATGVAFVCLSEDGENAITVAPGANMTLSAADLPSLDGVACLLLQLESPLEAVTAWARRARAAGVKVVLNAAPACRLPEELLDAVDVLVVNEGELAAVAGIADPGRALAALAVPMVVVTLGGAGAVARRRDGRRWMQPAYDVVPVDTTGAGDTFCGALCAALARGADAGDAMREAAAAAALACTRAGAQTGVPARAEVLALVAAGRLRDGAALHARFPSPPTGSPT